MGLGRVTIPSNSSFEQTSRILNDLVRKMPAATDEIKRIKDLRNGLSDVTKRVKEAKEQARNGEKLAKEAQARIKELKGLKKEFDKISKQFTPMKKALDNLKKGLLKEIMPTKYANAIMGAAGLFATGMSFMLLNSQGQLQEADIRKENVTLRQASKEMQRIFEAYRKAEANEKSIQKIKADVDATKKTVYADVQNMLKQIPDIRKKANDALYEVRQGRKILEDKIAAARKMANDALYETRQGRQIVEGKVAEARKLGNDALYETRANTAKLTATIGSKVTEVTQQIKASLGTQINAIKQQSDSVKQQVNSVKQQSDNTATKVSNLEKAVNSGDSNVQRNLIDKVNKAIVDIAGLTASVKQIPSLLRNESNNYAIPQAFKLADGKIERVKAEFQGQVKQFVDRDMMITEVTAAVGNQIVRLGTPIMNAATEPLKATDAALNQKVGELSDRLGQQQQNLERLKREIEGNKNDLDKLKKNDKEQEKVNQEGNRKLDELLRWSLSIPPILAAIPAKTNNLIRPAIPTIPQIGQTVRDNVPQQTCRFDPNPINSHTTALDVAQTALIVDGNQTIKKVDEATKIINNKLGGQIAGGISGKLMRFSAWIQLDRVLNILTFAATVQNHLMLSRDIGTTLLGAFSNILSIIGLKDDEGQPYKVGDIINSSIENFIKGIVGAENYASLSEAWAKANRIYQATTNVLNSFQQLSSTILSGMELIAGNNSKIGNALKKAGIVLETAYGWMNPQPKFNRVTQALEKFQASASTIQQVTQAPLDIINATTELQNANTELIKAIKEDNKPENKAPEIPEPDELKAKETESKSVSQPLPFEFSDLFDGEDL